MCEMCDKVHFLIESMEQLFTQEEWLELFERCIKTNQLQLGGEPDPDDEAKTDYLKMLREEPRNIWVNVIAKITARMLFNRNIHPELFLPIFMMNVQELWFSPHLQKHMEEKAKLSDYDS